ncbi:MAG TPA: BTAD domain-containing putative transcriptional regulator, partial [Acidimicrobiia bacterium]|nr:BTAD domain-containing putative transcriptional regulator [Acidimicrobiia bacterium]
MLFRILCNVSVVDDGVARAVAAPRQRALLALLLLDTNRVVTRSTLVEGIWGDDGPQHEDAALQVVMSRLRRTIGPAADRITSTGAGYRLDAGPEEVDLTKAEMMLREGRAQLALNNGARAANILDEALAHWDGNPLDDLAAFPFQPDAARRLRELWFAIYEARTDAYLMDGRHLEVVADIGPRVRVEPLREHLRAQQIAALYRSGRQADALAAAGELRKTLRDELGISPSPALQQLEQRVLDQDPTLLSTNAGVLPALPPWTAEALPFVGRESELESALQAMRDAVVTGFEFVLVEGDPGSGKSRFLLEVARRIGRDAVVVPVDVHEALHASVVALARGIDEAARRLSPRDRLLTLGDAHPGDRIDDEPTVEQIHAEAPRWLAALSGKAPVLLLVDDLDRAGPGLLHVIAQLALLESSKRVLIVAGARPPQTTGVSPLERLVGALEVRDQATRIVLPPLGLDDLDVLLGRMHVAPRRRITRRLHDLTAGNAFLLNELLSTGQPERMLDTWQVPPRVRDVVLARVDELGRGVKEVLQHAAVVGFDFTISTLAEVCETSEMVVRAAVDRAISARILQPSGAHTVRFAHDLARRTLIEELPASERSLIHRRIALLLEATDVPAAGLAAHWSRADGPDVAAKTAFYARVAGDDAMRVLEPYHAARWYHLALEHVTDTKTRGELLAALAEALQQAGDPAFVDTLHEATRIAIDLDDDDLILRIVISTSPGFVNLPGFTAA